jgi:hypothetical protein
MNAIWASTIIRIPSRVKLAQYARNVIFDFGLDGKKVRVKRAATKGAKPGSIH